MYVEIKIGKYKLIETKGCYKLKFNNNKNL